MFDLFESLSEGAQNELFRALEEKKEHYDKLLEELLAARKILPRRAKSKL